MHFNIPVMLYVHASNWEKREKNIKLSVLLFSYLQHCPSSKLSLKILKMTCWKQTQYIERAESLPGKPPCTIAVPACTSGYLHSWQTFNPVSSSNPHHTQTQCLSFFWRPWAYFPEIFLSLRANRLSVSIMRCHQLY